MGSAEGHQEGHTQRVRMAGISDRIQRRKDKALDEGLQESKFISQHIKELGDYSGKSTSSSAQKK